jgi:hypothetical protein
MKYQQLLLVSIVIHPIVNLKAKASSGGSVQYAKTPKSIERRASSGGSMIKYKLIDT